MEGVQGNERRIRGEQRWKKGCGWKCRDDCLGMRLRGGRGYEADGDEGGSESDAKDQECVAELLELCHTLRQKAELEKNEWRSADARKRGREADSTVQRIDPEPSASGSSVSEVDAATDFAALHAAARYAKAAKRDRQVRADANNAKIEEAQEDEDEDSGEELNRDALLQEIRRITQPPTPDRIGEAWLHPSFTPHDYQHSDSDVRGPLIAYSAQAAPALPAHGSGDLGAVGGSEGGKEREGGKRRREVGNQREGGQEGGREGEGRRTTVGSTVRCALSLASAPSARAFTPHLRSLPPSSLASFPPLPTHDHVTRLPRSRDHGRLAVTAGQTPQTIRKHLEGRGVRLMAAGLAHVVLVCDDGAVLTAGDNAHHALGRPTADAERCVICCVVLF
jgi:hypothetical protein